MFKGSFHDSLRWDDLQQNEFRHLLTFDGGLDLALGTNLKAQTRARVATEWTSAPVVLHDYQPYRGLPFNPQLAGDGTPSDLKKKTWDMFAVRADYQSQIADLSLGLDWIQLGPGVRTHLLWAGESNRDRPWDISNAYSTHSAPIFFGAWDAEFLATRYRQWTGRLSERKDLSKNFHHHRLDVQMGSWNLGLGETVVYGTVLEPEDLLEEPVPREVRGVQWIYALPFVPYLYAQEYLGDRDNTMINADLAYQWSWGRVYGELLIDDMKSPGSFFKQDWWGNKYAAMGGLELHRQIGVWRARAVSEWTRIEPWMYTHRFGRGMSWTHFGQSLGSDLGPNALEAWVALSVQHSQGWKLSAEYVDVQKGTDHGSGLADIHWTTERLDKTFLAPDSVQSYREITGIVSTPEWRGLSWDGRVARLWGDWRGWRLGSNLRWNI